ncbi:MULTISPECIES: GDSL-type esterase/lipase family protein [unclassified Streptomyces]|uniref:GDSL-type esterase/lipase family protein n=1 Tax=unclassified Streptomyces TaxID=2593676 RepID=UPI0016612CFE|nr:MULTISPECIES: GDSL-type esterase/lipase family protein [unclassified Streptomyces]MBD0711419.1 GDSL family lipase [Streptomyces sp. CBMA291]MBD0717079.1 GDSL family lipase [Streptomyces sp. CBMA370]
MDWLDPVRFLRGTAWLDGDRPVRADPADLARLPWDIAERAALPIGVRIEFAAGPGTRAVQLRYRAAVPERTDPLAGLRHCFALWHGTRFVGETCAAPVAESTVTLPLPPGGGVFTVHLPEGQAPVPLALRALGGELSAAPDRPRWLVHGDSITEGWWSTRPALSWPATVGRNLGLDTVNLGFAGGARGELALAEQLARLPGELITLAFGTNCWSRVPATADWLYATVRAFVGLVRRGHPDTPLLVVSPVLRPAAERRRNALGATLAELRGAMERAGRDLAAEGDGHLLVLPGGPLLAPEHLADGLHPDDRGHARIAAAVTEALRPHVPSPGGR